jgi:hypothetical protein
MPITAPNGVPTTRRSCAWWGRLPILRTLHQPPLYRISMDVAQLLNSLLLAPYVEVIVPQWPEVPADLHASPRSGLLHRPWGPQEARLWLAGAERHSQRLPLRLSYQKAHAFRHDHIADSPELVLATSALKRMLKQSAWGSRQTRFWLAGAGGAPGRAVAFAGSNYRLRNVNRRPAGNGANPKA